MKKLLFALFIPMMGTAQTVQDTTVVKAPLSVIKTTGKKDTLSISPVFINQVNKATSDIATVSTQVGTLATTVNSLNAITTQQGVAINGLQTTINGLQVVVPPPGKAIYDNTYTLTDADNGGVLYVYVTCTISCPLLFKDFSCKIIRMGTASSATVTITGAQSVYGYRRLLIPYADAAINYATNSLPILTGRISK